MADYSRHVPGLASSNRSRSEYGQFSNHGRQILFGVGDSQLYNDMMSTSSALNKYEPIASSAVPVSQADLSLKTFCDNLTAGGPTTWKSLESSVNGNLSHMYQYPIPSSEEGQGDQSVAPEEFDIPHLHATTVTRNSTIGPNQLYFSKSGDTVAQPILTNSTPGLQNASAETSRARSESKLTGSNSAQIYDAARSRPVETEGVVSGAEAFRSMDNAETLRSSQNPFTNSELGASTSTDMLPKNDIQNLSHSVEKRDENLMTNSGRDDANGGQMLLPHDGAGSTLPAGKVFPIQIGSELFKLSGASISSDAPSYFSQFFSEQLLVSDGRSSNIRTLYIDRDPATFKDIVFHLQGYHIEVRDAAHFVRLFADAQFYSLPRLIRQLLYSEIHISIGDTQFQIPRDVFSAPGDSPNYFTLGFGAFFSSPNDTFPGLDKQGLLRPPSIHPPSLPNRSAEVFKELLHYLKGYPIEVRSETHRVTLLKEARYFHFKGLEQRLLPHEISYNVTRQSKDILLRLEDIRQSGISFASDVDNNNYVDESSSHSGTAGKNSASARNNLPAGTVRYSRPYVDDDAYELVLETSDETTTLNLEEMRVIFSGQTKARVASLLQVIVNKMNLPATQPLGLMLMTTGGGLAAQPASPSLSGLSNEHIRVRFDNSTHIKLDGRTLDPNNISSLTSTTSSSSSFFMSTSNSYRDEVTSKNENIAFPVKIPFKRRKLDSVNDVYDDENDVTNNHLYDNNQNIEGNNEENNRGADKNNDHNVYHAQSTTGNARAPVGNGIHHLPPGADAARSKKWTVTRAQWRIRIEPALKPSSMTRNNSSASTAAASVTSYGSDSSIGVEVIFCAVRLDVLSGEKARNAQRGFLT